MTDSPLALGFYQQPNSSGDNGTKPCAFGVHDIECPPAILQPGNGWYDRKYASLMGPDYLQNKAEEHSVQYGIFGSVILQGLLESWWAWGMGTPASKHTTHVEQSGYASFTTAQWLGQASAIGTSYTRASDGVVQTYDAACAEAMAAQFHAMASLYADWCHRNGYVPKLGTMDELERTCRGEQLGILFTHAMASQIPGTTTFHTDPGSNYPVQKLVDAATLIYHGVTPPAPKPPTPKPPVPDPPKDEPLSAAEVADLKAYIDKATKAVTDDAHLNIQRLAQTLLNGTENAVLHTWAQGADALGLRGWLSRTAQVIQTGKPNRAYPKLTPGGTGPVDGVGVYGQPGVKK